MARIEWVKLRLDNWALWKDKESSGGLGWASQAAFLNEASTDRYRESRIPIDDVDAGLTNTGVESLKAPPRSHLYETLQLIYPRGLGIRETARRTGCAESTIKARLEQADRVLADWFAERKQAREKSLST